MPSQALLPAEYAARKLFFAFQNALLNGKNQFPSPLLRQLFLMIALIRNIFCSQTHALFHARAWGEALRRKTRVYNLAQFQLRACLFRTAIRYSPSKYYFFRNPK